MGAQRKVWKMNKAYLQGAGLLLLCSLSACQRPTQVLPAAPQFEMQDGKGTGADDANSLVRDALSASDVETVTDGIVPGSVEDFLRYAGTDKVYFEYDKADLLPEGKATLDRQAEWLAKYPAVRASLEGHADERGTREYNFALGDRRAAAMRFHLLARGIASERLSTTSFGKERPLVAGSDDSAWSLNRRGETGLIGAVGQQ